MRATCCIDIESRLHDYCQYATDTGVIRGRAHRIGWLASDLRSDYLNPTENVVDSWELGVAGGAVSVALNFDHTAANIDLYLYDPDGNQVAESTTDSDHEGINYETNTVTGTYRIEVIMQQ